MAHQVPFFQAWIAKKSPSSSAEKASFFAGFSLPRHTKHQIKGAAFPPQEGFFWTYRVDDPKKMSTRKIVTRNKMEKSCSLPFFLEFVFLIFFFFFAICNYIYSIFCMYIYIYTYNYMYIPIEILVSGVFYQNLKNTDSAKSKASWKVRCTSSTVESSTGNQALLYWSTPGFCTQRVWPCENCVFSCQIPCFENV